MTQNMLRDLIYFDFDKAASINSQISGGLLQEMQSAEEKTRNIDGGIKLPIANIGGVASDSRSQMEKSILHHDLLVRLEDSLFESDLAKDLNKTFGEKDTDYSGLQNTLSKLTYIRSEGWGLIQDYSRLTRVIKAYDRMRDIIITSAKYTSYEDAMREFSERRKKAQEIKSTKQREEEIKKIEEDEQHFESEIANLMGLVKLDDWLVDGIEDIVNLLMPGYLNFRLTPFYDYPEFQILANLKRECFIDNDVENVIFAYGSKPNIKLTLFGLITSVPSQNSNNPIKRVEPNTRASDLSVFEQTFQNIFYAMEDFENFGRFSYEPNITVYPIAIYRTILPIK